MFGVRTTKRFDDQMAEDEQLSRYQLQRIERGNRNLDELVWVVLMVVRKGVRKDAIRLIDHHVVGTVYYEEDDTVRKSDFPLFFNETYQLLLVGLTSDKN